MNDVDASGKIPPETPQRRKEYMGVTSFVTFLFSWVVVVAILAFSIDHHDLSNTQILLTPLFPAALVTAAVLAATWNIRYDKQPAVARTVLVFAIMEAAAFVIRLMLPGTDTNLLVLYIINSSGTSLLFASIIVVVMRKWQKMK